MEEKTKKEWFGSSEYFEQMRAGVHGSFTRSLSQAWVNADGSNRRKLVEAFPEIFPTKYQYYF